MAVSCFFYYNMLRKQVGVIKQRGILFAALAASFWAVSGLLGQSLFTDYHFRADWLVSVRLFFSGIILLGLAKGWKKEAIFAPFKKRQDLGALLIFSVFGMFAVQLTYFKTIELSNASFGTIIQYTGPFFVILYESFKQRKAPSFLTVLLLFTTALGVVFIATKGEFTNLSISLGALVWGIGSAVSLAFYSLQPRRLLATYGSFVTVGWGMLFGSIFSNILQPMWRPTGVFTAGSMLSIFLVVTIGTALAFLLYLSSLHYISSSLASTLTAFEPLLATVFSIIIFSLPLTLFEVVGFFLVLSSILLIQKKL